MFEIVRAYLNGLFDSRQISQEDYLQYMDLFQEPTIHTDNEQQAIEPDSLTIKIGPWIFHPFDNDPKPSIPHGHHQDNPEQKLDPWTGKVWEGKKHVGSISKKEKERILSDPRFKDIARKASDHHANNQNRMDF